MALPTSGLVINLDSRSLNAFVFTNQGVGTWPDQSGSGNNAVWTASDGAGGSTAPPIYYPNMTPNGSPALQFDNGAMLFSSNTLFNTSTSAEIFIYVLIFSATADNSGLYQFGGNDNTYYCSTDGNVYDGSFTNSRYSFPGVTPTSWHIYNVSHDGTTRTTRIDGTTVHSVSVGFTPPSAAVKSGMRIGRSQGVPWQGRIAGFLAYNRSLTSTERTQVTDYLNTAYISTAPASDPQVAQIPAAGLKMDLPVTFNDPLLVIPAASLTLDLPLTFNDPLLVIPAAGLSIAGHAAVPTDAIITIPPARLATDLSITLSPARLTLTAPADSDTLRITRPTFTVAVTAPDPTATYTIQIQYDDNLSFTHPTTLSSPVTAADGGVSLAATTDVPAASYWRARLLLGSAEEVAWSNPSAFTVISGVAATTLSVQWTADPAADRPIHLWHLDPPGPLDGDTVTIYGQGFPTTGTLTYGDTALPTISWQLVAATADNANDATRAIEGSVVTPEHYEVQFTAPVDDGPGGALVLEA